jgi:putative membrane protein
MQKNSKSKYPIYLFGIFIVIWIILAINPSYRMDWLLENILVFVSIPALIIWYRKGIFSNTSYTLIFIFLVMHVVGSHYTYAEVPVGDLFNKIIPSTRNHYDRFVHFMFGVLIFLPAQEFFRNYFDTSKGWSYYLSLTLLICLGALYELLEWLSAVVVDPKAGIAFLGSQGDVFDAQKDFAYNVVGALLSMLVIMRLKRKNEGVI